MNLFNPTIFWTASRWIENRTARSTPPTLRRVRAAVTRRTRRGFTLIEMLVVIAILGLLMALIMPSLSRAQQAARRIACASNLRQVGQAATMWSADNRGHLVIGHDLHGAMTGSVNMSYFIYLRPYLGYEPHRAGMPVAEIFISPGNRQRTRSYMMNAETIDRRPGRGTPRRTYQLSDISAPSSLMYFGPSVNDRTNWIDTFNAQSIANVPENWFGNGTANFLFVDGHVESIPVRDIFPGQPRNGIFFDGLPPGARRM